MHSKVGWIPKVLSSIAIVLETEEQEADNGHTSKKRSAGETGLVTK